MLVGIVIVVYNIPGPQTVGDFVFCPIRLVAWVAGYALRGRRAGRSGGRARDARGRRGQPHASRWRRSVCESPARLTTSSLTLSASWSPGRHRRHNLTAASEDHDLLRGVERAGRTALAEMRRLLAAMRREGTKLNSRPRLARRPRFVARRSQPRWSAGRVTCRRTPFPLPQRDRPLLTASFKRA